MVSGGCSGSRTLVFTKKRRSSWLFTSAQLILITTCELGFQLKYVTYNLHNTFINTLILIPEVRSWPGMFHSNTRHCSLLMDRHGPAPSGCSWRNPSDWHCIQEMQRHIPLRSFGAGSDGSIAHGGAHLPISNGTKRFERSLS